MSKITSFLDEIARKNRNTFVGGAVGGSLVMHVITFFFIHGSVGRMVGGMCVTVVLGGLLWMMLRPRKDSKNL